MFEESERGKNWCKPETNSMVNIKGTSPRVTLTLSTRSGSSGSFKAGGLDAGEGSTIFKGLLLFLAQRRRRLGFRC